MTVGGSFGWLPWAGSEWPPACSLPHFTLEGVPAVAVRSNRVPASTVKRGMRRRFGCGHGCAVHVQQLAGRGSATKAQAAAQNGGTPFGGQHSKTNKAAWRRAAVATPVPCQGWISQPSASMAVQQHGRPRRTRGARAPRHAAAPPLHCVTHLSVPSPAIRGWDAAEGEGGQEGEWDGGNN